MSANESGRQKRNYFRLEYFRPDRPIITITEKSFEIIDLSEKGVKFEIPRGFRPKLNVRVAGVIELPDKSKFDVMGHVLRTNLETRECVLYLEEGLPLAKMLEEQRRLIQKYKK